MSPVFDDTDDDVPLPQRGDGYGTQPDRSARELDRGAPDKEFTLNTGVVLALFFALALLCAVFFGFGYSIGHKSAPAAPVVAHDDAAPAGTPVVASTGSLKPSPGTPAVPEYVPPSGAVTRSVTVPAASTPAPRPATAASAPLPDVIAKPPAPIVRAAPTPVAIAPAAPAPAPVAGGTTYVQVAAVSHPEDAEVLLSALRRRGYTVQTRSDPNDHLIHVQIGPFITRKDADTMKQKLQGDGYNAILK